MKLKGLVDEDFLQYKKPSMFIICPYCTFKCDKESGTQICQNWSLSKAEVVDYPIKDLVRRYLMNEITKSVVFGGLEPLETFDDLYEFIKLLRVYSNDDIVIYTGFKEEEVIDKINKLKEFKNIIIKFGRYIPGQEKHLDPILGVELSSNNQYALKIS